MIMKRFLVINMLMMVVASALACGYAYTHNYYMLSLDPLEDTYSTITDRTNQFWNTYTSGQVTSYDYDQLLAVAKQKGDKEMISYLNALNLYLSNCGDLYNSWEYPTKERKDQIRSDFYTIFAQAAEYEGTKLKPQYALLQMRANMQLKRHEQNKKYWESTASKLPASVYKEMMENIYAGALFNLGDRNKSAEIFARQGDRTSIRWALRGYRNLAGVKKLYSDNPNSIALAYLVSEFVNSFQEMLDNQGDEEWTKMNGKVPIQASEAQSFVAFANQVVAENKTTNPCMWKTAVGMVNYLLKNQKQAETDMAQAVTLAGLQRSKDNARCVRLLVMAASSAVKSDFMVSELQWLEQKASSEKESDYCFSNALDRIYMQELADKYKRTGNTNMRLATIARMSERVCQSSEYHYRAKNTKEDSWNSDYHSDIFVAIDDLSAEDTESFFNFLTQSHSDPLESYLCKNSYAGADYWYDLIGTKYLGEAQFEKAISFLQKVNLAFLNKQNISHYLANRDFKVEKWFKRQKSEGEWWDGSDDGMNKGHFTVNPKLAFCKDMVSLMKTYKKATDMEECRKAAYQLGARLYQASYKGDCWYLTDYGHSSSETECKSWQKDFVKLADEYLSISALSDNPDLKLKSLFALSYIAPDWWREPIRDNSWKVTGYNMLEDTKKYQALEKLNSFIKYGGAPKADYISRCDVIRQFAASN